MPSGEDSAQIWIERGRQAYWRMQLPEAAADFEKAVAADSNSVQARLCYGVACLFLYQNGLSDAQPAFFDPAVSRRWSDAEVKAELQRIQTYQQILELNPQHGFANYVCGAINFEKAFELIRSGGYPRPIQTDEARRTLSAQISPVLNRAERNLLRTLEIDPGNSRPMNYLMLVSKGRPGWPQRKMSDRERARKVRTGLARYISNWKPKLKRRGAHGLRSQEPRRR